MLFKLRSAKAFTVHAAADGFRARHPFVVVARATYMQRSPKVIVA
jgi:hypothetical protein